MASNDMKRVGLVFDADGTADFKKSLSTVNASLQENRAQFKLTKSEWEKNTSASQKLKQTNEYLAKQYDESSKKVNVLTSELNELEKAEVRDEKAISKKKAALATAETSMNYYKKGLEETSSKLKAGTADIEDYAKKLQAASDKSISAGKTMTTHLTAPIIAIGTAAMIAWNEIDSAYDNIAAGTGAVGDSLTDLQNSFDTVFGSMPVDAKDASVAIADLNTRFGYTGKKLEEASESFLKFAKVNNTDVSSSIALVTRAMGDANISADEYQSILDALTVAAQNSGIGIDKLTENITKYGAPMRALGYDTKESIAIFASWEKAGVNTEIAFGGMKKAISNFSAQGKDAKVEFAKMLEEIKNAPSIAAATSKAIEVFGAKAGPDLADAIKNGRFEFKEMLDLIENSNGKLEDTYNEMLDPADESKVAMNNLKLAGAELGEVIQTALAPIFKKLSEVLKGLTKWFKGLDDNTQTIIVTIGGVLAALGPLLVIFGTLAGAVSKIMLLYTSFTNASAAAGGATTVLSGSLSSIIAPIIAVIAVIALVVGAIIQLWNSNEQFRIALTEAWIGIQDTINNIWTTVLQPIFDSIVTMLLNIWDNGIKPLWDHWVEFVGTIIICMTQLWEKIKPLIDWIVNVFGPIFVVVFDIVAQAIGTAIASAMSTFGGFFDFLSMIIKSITQIIGGIIDFITGVFTGNWSKAWGGVKDIFGGVFNGLIGIAKAPLNTIIGFINTVIDVLNSMIGGLNKINWEIPDWVPAIGGTEFGFNLPKIGKLSYLAKGGDLLGGMAIVGEAGPEMLLQNGNRTTVAPLSRGGGANPVDIVDYDKMAGAFIKALKYLTLKLDDNVVGEFIDERMLKAVL